MRPLLVLITIWAIVCSAKQQTPPPPPEFGIKPISNTSSPSLDLNYITTNTTTTLPISSLTSNTTIHHPNTTTTTTPIASSPRAEVLAREEGISTTQLAKIRPLDTATPIASEYCGLDDEEVEMEKHVRESTDWRRRNSCAVPIDRIPSWIAGLGAKLPSSSIIARHNLWDRWNKDRSYESEPDPPSNVFGKAWTAIRLYTVSSWEAVIRTVLRVTALAWRSDPPASSSTPNFVKALYDVNPHLPSALAGLHLTRPSGPPTLNTLIPSTFAHSFFEEGLRKLAAEWESKQGTLDEGYLIGVEWSEFVRRTSYTGDEGRVSIPIPILDQPKEMGWLWTLLTTGLVPGWSPEDCDSDWKEPHPDASFISNIIRHLRLFLKQCRSAIRTGWALGRSEIVGSMDWGRLLGMVAFRAISGKWAGVVGFVAVPVVMKVLLANRVKDVWVPPSFAFLIFLIGRSIDAILDSSSLVMSIRTIVLHTSGHYAFGRQFISYRRSENIIMQIGGAAMVWLGELFNLRRPIIRPSSSVLDICLDSVVTHSSAAVLACSDDDPSPPALVTRSDPSASSSTPAPETIPAVNVIAPTPSPSQIQLNDLPEVAAAPEVPSARKLVTPITLEENEAGSAPVSEIEETPEVRGTGMEDKVGEEEESVGCAPSSGDVDGASDCSESAENEAGISIIVATSQDDPMEESDGKHDEQGKPRTASAPVPVTGSLIPRRMSPAATRARAPTASSVLPTTTRVSAASPATSSARRNTTAALRPISLNISSPSVPLINPPAPSARAAADKPSAPTQSTSSVNERPTVVRQVFRTTIHAPISTSTRPANSTSSSTAVVTPRAASAPSPADVQTDPAANVRVSVPVPAKPAGMSEAVWTYETEKEDADIAAKVEQIRERFKPAPCFSQQFDGKSYCEEETCDDLECQNREHWPAGASTDTAPSSAPTQPPNSAPHDIAAFLACSATTPSTAFTCRTRNAGLSPTELVEWLTDPDREQDLGDDVESITTDKTRTSFFGPHGNRIRPVRASADAAPYPNRVSFAHSLPKTAPANTFFASVKSSSFFTTSSTPPTLNTFFPRIPNAAIGRAKMTPVQAPLGGETDDSKKLTVLQRNVAKLVGKGYAVAGLKKLQQRIRSSPTKGISQECRIEIAPSTGNRRLPAHASRNPFAAFPATPTRTAAPATPTRTGPMTPEERLERSRGIGRSDVQRIRARR